jgi:bacterioferritin-associated ferredoxin
MYVCICHGYNEACIEEAVESGASNLADLYDRLGERPRCGKCVADVLRIYQERRPSSRADNAG